jgi:predicted ATPase/DNA-binding winged helix-turn-helix (wHTH) protein
MESRAQATDAVSFGPFTLLTRQRLLTRSGATVELGERALEILITLLRRPNQPISKRELMAKVWPDVTVGEGSLRFHIAGLRKALGDGQDGARYIATLAGRGYCFVAPLSRSPDAGPPALSITAGFPLANVPSRLGRMVGRADSILMVSGQLTATRFVTIVGAGGVGKTTIAVAVGHDLMKAFAGAVLFIDLGALSDPRLVATSLASLLGLSIQSADPAPGLIAYLRDKRILLIFDNCEHLIETVAALAAQIFLAAPQTHILATSREPLRVEGEHVYRLAPLSFPPDEPGLTAAEALTFPAIQLFMERAAASGTPLDLTDSNAAVIANICRKLDGLALAIELAAGRVGVYGLQQTAALLEERLSLMWLGQRNAPRRQQTLKATLDWSYGLLSEPEQWALRQLAVFLGHFTLEGARAVLAGAAIDQAGILGAMDSLATKSLVAPSGATTGASAAGGRWRLLESIRAYSLEKLDENNEGTRAARAHARFYRDLVETAAPVSRSDTTLSSLSICSREIDNVRAALDWAFSSAEGAEIGVRLTAAYVPVWLHFGRYSECRERTEQALGALESDSGLERPARMQLHGGLGMAMLYTMGAAERVASMLTKALELAEGLDDIDTQLRMLWALWLLHVDTGDLRTAQVRAKEFALAARRAGDSAVVFVADRLAGYTLQFGGDQPAAQRCVERVLDLYGTSKDLRQRFWFLHDERIATHDLLARSLWLQGLVDQAARHARLCLDEAELTGNSLSICEALRLAVAPIALATGDLTAAERAVAMLNDHAARHNATYWRIVGHCLEGELLIRRGVFAEGAALLGAALDSCKKTGWAVCYPANRGVLAEGLMGLGRHSEASLAVEESLEAAERGGERWSVAELLRIKGECLLAQDDHRYGSKIDDCFAASLAIARQQGALFWELRAAMGFARLRARQGQLGDAKKILAPVYERFTEGFGTPDLMAAERLLATLS